MLPWLTLRQHLQLHRHRRPVQHHVHRLQRQQPQRVRPPPPRQLPPGRGAPRPVGLVSCAMPVARAGAVAVIDQEGSGLGGVRPWDGGDVGGDDHGRWRRGRAQIVGHVGERGSGSEARAGRRREGRLVLEFTHSAMEREAEQERQVSDHDSWVQGATTPRGRRSRQTGACPSAGRAKSGLESVPSHRRSRWAGGLLTTSRHYLARWPRRREVSGCA